MDTPHFPAYLPAFPSLIPSLFLCVPGSSRASLLFSSPLSLILLPFLVPPACICLAEDADKPVHLGAVDPLACIFGALRSGRTVCPHQLGAKWLVRESSVEKRTDLSTPHFIHIYTLRAAREGLTKGSRRARERPAEGSRKGSAKDFWS